MLIFSLITVYSLYIKKQKEFEICVKNAQEKREKTYKEVLIAWVGKKVPTEWKEQAYLDVKENYDNEIKDCLLIK